MDRPSKESSLLINLVKYADDLYDFINFYIAILIKQDLILCLQRVIHTYSLHFYVMFYSRQYFKYLTFLSLTSYPIKVWTPTLLTF